ncbi:Ubiquinone/menaquinone biosynthesis C-methylase UbiE [bacterium A37T11]|nr:Ubiquinone/menaquinone biosynthesis C-methylase UbiE [bacterium A37T11]
MISENIKVSYSEQYDDSSIAWRMQGARYKAQNIVNICKGRTFERVLEVGAGEGSILKCLSDWEFGVHLHGIEISESGIEMIRKKQIARLKEVLLFDGYQIPYPDAYFDLVICSHVMEHVEHERLLLREIKRVSKQQIFEVPIDFSFYVDRKIKHFLDYGHINIYTPALFRFLLKSEHFSIEKDCCYHYENAMLEQIFKGNRKALLMAKLKRFVLKKIPYLGGIKPNSYVVLTSADEGSLHIF